MNPEEFRAPDIAGTVEGWRCWRVQYPMDPWEDYPKLFSVSHKDYFWKPCEASEAICQRHRAHVPPVRQCSCGFYAAKTVKHLLSMPYHYYLGEVDGWWCVVGQVDMWGADPPMIEGSYGWRSRFAYPVRLFVPYEIRQLGRPLANAYQVPVRITNILSPAAAVKIRSLQRRS